MQKIKEKLAQIGLFIKNCWKNHRKKTIAVLVIVFLIILLGGKSGNDTTTTHTVQVGDVIDQVVLSGRTEPVNFVDLGFADAGRVQKVYVSEGQEVKQGQILAELEMGDLSAQLMNARAGLTIAQANARQSIDNVEKVTREQNALVQTAKRALFGSLEAFPDDEFSTRQAPIITGSYQGDEAGEYILEFYASHADTGVSIRYSGLETGIASVTMGSRVPLGTKGLYIQFTDVNGYANTKWKIPVPNTRSAMYPTLLNNYETAQATRDRVITQAESEVASGGNSVVQARVEQAQSAVNQITSAMSKRRIVAPFSGTVSKVVLKQGESTIGMTNTTSPGVSMLATDQYKVVVKIPEIDVARIAPNTPVQVVLDTYGTEEIFEGVLATINPAETIIDGVPVYEGTVVFNDTDDRIRSGMTATVTIKLQEQLQVTAIPREYLSEKNGNYHVSVQNHEGKITEQPVTTGIFGSNGLVEIIDGVSVDQVLVLPKK